MNDNELKTLWRQQPLREPEMSVEQLISAMQTQTKGLRRTLLARDVRELSACIFVGVVFTIYAFVNQAPFARLGAWITVAGSIFVGWRILRARRATPPAKPDATVVESLRAELLSVRTQARLLRSVLWWYLLPLAAGVLVFVWGLPLGNLFFGLVFKIAFTLGEVAVNVFIYRLNQRAVSKDLLPVEAQLESMLRSTETGEPLDEEKFAELRPIVLSMAAAQKVKPLEFKVAFWQLAVFGVPGVLGIWFFLTIVVTMSSTDWKVAERVVAAPASVHYPIVRNIQPFLRRFFSWQHLLWGALSFAGGLIYTWLIQKTTLRAVGISTLGIHLSKGQSLVLWDEIKEVRPFKFLHIRNLWLIRDSGEKTLMHWTPLERHSDLKAAVESSAPADHPIRKYLELISG